LAARIILCTKLAITFSFLDGMSLSAAAAPHGHFAR
jgi:hypothetical protein